MSTVQLEAQVSPEELLKAVKQLPPTELDQFVRQVVSLRATQAPSLPHVEAELLLKINQDIPTSIRMRYDELIAKRKAENLANEEHVELLKLTKEVENIEAKRIEALSQLAQLRKTPLTTLMQSLGIRAPVYA